MPIRSEGRRFRIDLQVLPDFFGKLDGAFAVATPSRNSTTGPSGLQ